jgi:CubicO group peptidase (beta-lactamase class C family)
VRGSACALHQRGALNRSLDPYRYVLSLPVVEPAGSVWNYSGGATALIGGILGRATGKRFDVLAATLLFDPLDVSDVAWTWLPNGDPKNWCCLWMRPRDMAKIGRLVLDRGHWNGGQVVSETWINAATAPQIKTIYRGLDYGFQFWLGASFVAGRLGRSPRARWPTSLYCADPRPRHSGDRGQLLRQ